MVFSARDEVRALVRVLLADGLDALGNICISPQLRVWLIEHVSNGKALLAVAVASCQDTELEQPLSERICRIPKLVLSRRLNSRLKLLKG